MIKVLQRNIYMYTSRGFQAIYVVADNEFKCARTILMMIHLNVVPRNAHMPDAERSIRTTKEIVWCTSNGLPFKQIPKIMVTSIVIQSTSQLNNISTDNGVSRQISLTTIVASLPSSDYNTVRRIPFGAYAQFNKDHSLRNNNHPRTTGAIALHVTCNQQGSY